MKEMRDHLTYTNKRGGKETISISVLSTEGVVTTSLGFTSMLFLEDIPNFIEVLQVAIKRAAELRVKFAEIYKP